VKLPVTAEAIIREPWAEPSSHGLGRHGWVTMRFDRAVAMTDDSGPRRRQTLVFDPRTSTLLATETTLLERISELDADPPVHIGYAVFLESKVVDELP
jgi:hypothetical protein